MKKTIFIPLILLAVLAAKIDAQELRCMVQVVSPSVQGTNRAVFEDMQKNIMEFMNNQQWTDNIFKPEERIDCNVMINITEQSGSDEFKGNLQIQSRRAVYNSAYNTSMLNYREEISFRYVEFQPLVYNPTSVESNLVAVLSYYAFIILGYDYDSFSPKGGTPYFQKAQEIVNMSQSASDGGKGWSSFDGTRNRYWLVENILNEYHAPLRTCLYQYHRRGLDAMADKPEEGRATIASALEQLQKVFRQRPNSFVMSLFFEAKREELVNVFTPSPSIEKAKVVNLLSEIDPSNADEYQKMLSARN
ncbi:MAG: DUF4835 family protein [Cytophagaceae bacterium]|nr:DUF4835 family protein [Cytophagaceae bacterium]